MQLEGKVAIVTGSGGEGSGRAHARRLAAEGCRVVVSDTNEAGGEETVRLIAEAGGRASLRHCDVSVKAEVEALVAYAESAYGRLDILINNASAPFHPGAPIEQWYAAIHTDLLGAIYGTQYAVDAMKRAGGGVIINVSSTSALAHGPVHANAPDYDMAKIAVIRLTTTLSGLRDSANVRVNCLVPDWVATPEVKEYFDRLPPEQRGTHGTPPVLTTLEEIAQAALDLITDETLAGRVLVWWSGQEPGLIPSGDAGYARLEPYPVKVSGS